MISVTEFVKALSEAINASPEQASIKHTLLHTHRSDARFSLEEAIKVVRGEVTDNDKLHLGLVDPIQLIQVLCVGASGSLEDFPSVSLEPSTIDPILYGLALQLRYSLPSHERQFVENATPEQLSKVYHLPSTMTVLELLKYGVEQPTPETIGSRLERSHEKLMETRSTTRDLLTQKKPLRESEYFHTIDGRTSSHPFHPFNQHIVKDQWNMKETTLGVKPTDLYEAGLKGLVDELTPDNRSARPSLIRTEAGGYKNAMDAELEAIRFRSFKDLFFAAAKEQVPLGVRVETTPAGIKFIVTQVTGENVKKALDTGVHGLIGGKRLLEVVKNDEWASRFLLSRPEVLDQLSKGEQVQRPSCMLDYTSLYTLIDTPEGYEDKFLCVIAKNPVHTSTKKED